MLYSANEIKLKNEVEELKAKLNLTSDLIKEVRYELISESLINDEEKIDWEKIDEIRGYVSDISDFLKY